MKLPPTRQFSCIERVNVPNLNRSICHLASTPKLQNDENKYNAFQELRKIKKRAGKEGQYEVNFLLKDYGLTETKALGRMYAKGSSLQYLGREYRKALVYDKYTDTQRSTTGRVSSTFQDEVDSSGAGFLRVRTEEIGNAKNTRIRKMQICRRTRAISAD